MRYNVLVVSHLFAPFFEKFEIIIESEGISFKSQGNTAEFYKIREKKSHKVFAVFDQKYAVFTHLEVSRTERKKNNTA